MPIDPDMMTRPESSSPTPTTDPMAPVRERIGQLQQKLDQLPAKVRLNSVRDQVGDLEAKSNRVADLARAVRELGYAWDKDLEPRCLDYRRRWQDLRPTVLTTIDRQSADLQARERQVVSEVHWAIQRATSPERAASVLPDAERTLGALTSAAEAAESSIQGMYDQFSSDLSTLQDHLSQVQEMLQLAARSCVSWLPGEAVVQVVKAQWDRQGKDDPRGFLLLSDQRLLFERNEDVATKKVLFVTTAKQHVQELMVDVPLAQITNIEASKRGMMGHEDHLDLTFASGSPLRSAHFHIDGQDCNMWQAMVNRAKSVGLEDTRVTPISEAEKTRLRNAPSRCSNCGGALTAPVLRGQTEIKCPYCGTVNRF